MKADNRLLLKGYLPVRVKFPSSTGTADEDNNDDDHETFFYVKEHQHKQQQQQQRDNHQDDAAAPTLFVANAPSFPPIDTPTMLQALLGKFGNIKRVTVVPNPRQPSASSSSNAGEVVDNPRTSWYFEGTVTDRFAHVVFETLKDLKRCIKALHKVMSNDSAEAAALVVDTVERQTLADALAQRRQQQQQQQRDADEGDASESSQGDDEEPAQELAGLPKVLHTYRRRQTRAQQRAALMEECNAVMQAYEEAEQARLRAISSEPDEDGFVTVTHATQPAVGEQLEQASSSTGRPTHGRSRKRKKGSGAAELPDFYRFQTKAKRRADVQDLRQRFQDDLERIRKIKDRSKGGFQPFG
eukprot:scaffold14698_cov196-Amphora_coffeaeformis.AAC.6